MRVEMLRYGLLSSIAFIALFASNPSAFAVPSGQSAPLGDASALTITGSGSTVPRTAAARAADETNALDFSSFQAAVTRATAAGKTLRLPAGAYSYTGGSLQITVPVVFEAGALLSCNANISFTNTVTASRNRIFASGCTPDFWGDKKQSYVFPEWWGAAGDSACTAGSGTDSTSAFANAIASGAAQISLAGNANYRFTGLSTTRSHLSIVGADRGSTLMCQDDATGALDGLALSGAGGQNTIKDINFSRIQSAIGSVASASVVAGGSGYAVGDTLTMAGGVFATAAVLKVTSVSSGAVTGVSVQTAGAYTQAAPPTATMTITPAVAQASTSGGGTGATFKLRWQGPADVRIQDGYFVTIEHNTFAGSGSWDHIRIEGATTNPNQIYMERNQIFTANHDNISIYGPSSSAVPGDIYIEDHNYISGAVFAGIEIYGYTNGIFETANTVYNNKYGNYWDAGSANYIQSAKIRSNDIDTNSSGDYYFGLADVHYQQNWHSDVSPLVCTSCVNLQAEGNNFTIGAGTAAAIFNGSLSIHFDGNNFTGGLAPIQVNPYNGTQSSQLTFAASNWSYGGGYFLTTTGTPSQITVGVQLTSTAQAIVAPTSTINNLTIVGSESPDNNSNNPFSSTLWGKGNTVGAEESAAGGNGNQVYGYGSVAFGASNKSGGSFSSANGYMANDDSLYGARCFASGSTTGGSGGQELCQHVLRARSTSASAVRLTSDGSSAGAFNCLNLPDNSHSQFMIMVSGFNPTAVSSANWSSNGPNILTRASGVSSVYYTGSYTSQTTAPVGTGTGTSAKLQLSADTTNGCLNVTITPPDSNTWDWEAAIVRLKMQ
ncbi:hypothetical protein CCR94_08040 [Rhodoblastus sphagnicola]|uniref:Right handed beta helix domain-containing protein n=2 Tax=Rhodoblastus sphagnicola TaxID=333368 RepID=A0A2S6NAY8_9HYPH|nr:hypothetical protein CCR94_08040 [Rhodoblastus sphagnicola]